MAINTLSTRDLEETRSDLEDELNDLVSNIPDDIEDESYVTEVEALAAWLGIGETDQIQFFGEQPWLEGADNCLAYAVDGSEGDKLTKLNELKDEIYDWKCGVTLIDDSDFTEYAEEYASETGSRRDISSWPYSCIDWDKAAEELGRDYNTVEYDGTTYRYRS